MAEESVEVLKFIGNDDECTLLVQENCTAIFPSKKSHTKGSSNLTLKNFVDFKWDHRYYRGQLIALHINEKLIAYGFFKPGTSEGLVRVVKRETDERVLIKGFSGIIEDISFAHLYEIIMLACVDQSGTVHVYLVKEDGMPKNLKVFPVFRINGDLSYSYQNKHLISWCQFIPEQVNHLKNLEYEPSYKGKILAVVRGSKVEIWHIGMASTVTTGPVSSNFKLTNPNDSVIIESIKSTVIKIDLREDFDIISVSFSADGSNISLALSNGSIYFYQVQFEYNMESPKCLFTWQPQEVLMSLKSMAFLDNRKLVDGDVESWKYVVTFSNQNEIILWSCETWQCLQKLMFHRSTITENPMKLTVDETGRYIFLSDIDNNLLFVMEVSIDINSTKNNMKIVSVTEILLQTPMLNIIIVNAKIDHNDVNYVEHNSGNNLNSLNKYSTIINLFAIQPKSIQEGQLIISSPEQCIKNQLVEHKIEHKNIFPKPPSLNIRMDTIDIAQNNTKIQQPKTQEKKKGKLTEMSSMEVHNLVKAKLKLRGINLFQKCSQEPEEQLQNKKTTSLILLPDTYQNTYDLDNVRECSPSNNEVQKILKQPKPETQYNYEVPKMHTERFESISNSEREGNTCFASSSVFNGSNISAIRQPIDPSQNVNELDQIYACIQDINSQLKCLAKNQKQIVNPSFCLPTNPSELCKILEPLLIGIIKNSNEQLNKKLSAIIDQQKKIADMVKDSSNSNKVDTEAFTRSVVASLNPTLDAILKDLFMSTVIPKFEHACCSMFKQIDASFTERWLEYQNELKLLINEESNGNYKFEYAIEKFKTDMSSIIKHTEKKILCSQNDMQKQFAFLLKEKSLSHVESFVKDSESIANQYMMLNNLIEHGDYATAFEKALTASNLDLVIYVCEKVTPEELFLTQNVISTPIILSLIQQLSHDLTNNTELKHKYLDAAVGSLNYTTDLHKDNINLVLIKVDSNLEKFMLQCPVHPFSRKLKMLQLAIKTIISFNYHPDKN